MEDSERKILTGIKVKLETDISCYTGVSSVRVDLAKDLLKDVNGMLGVAPVVVPVATTPVKKVPAKKAK